MASKFITLSVNGTLIAPIALKLWLAINPSTSADMRTVRALTLVTSRTFTRCTR